jgi:uncharacterized membrane protein
MDHLSTLLLKLLAAVLIGGGAAGVAYFLLKLHDTGS